MPDQSGTALTQRAQQLLELLDRMELSELGTMLTDDAERR
jgi:hypothetical protein